MVSLLLPRTWHDGTLWEVTIEELIVDSDVLVAYCILAVFNVHNTVHQQEWVPGAIKEAAGCS